MMQKLGLVIAAGLLSLSPLANAEKAFVYGTGAGSSCGRWTSEPPASVAALSLNSWLLGFVSGAGHLGPDLAESDGHALIAWVDKYCRENPLNSVMDAASALTYELRIRRAAEKLKR